MKDLEQSMAIILNDWMDEFTTDTERTMQKVALETVTLLQKTSPKDTGEYANGWTAKKSKGGIVTVYNDEKPMLTHLLEFGHAKVNGGRVRAYPHIAKAERWAQEELTRRLKG